jgi:hypothetical protein
VARQKVSRTDSINPPSAAHHGTMAGYGAGCRTRAGCVFDLTSPTLSCVEASIARRGDRELASLPSALLIPRDQHDRHLLISRIAEASREKHGTVWGYRRGCRQSDTCPHSGTALPTCTDARREYYRQYGERRLSGIGRPVDHGTNRGYLLGCTDSDRCPGGADGVSCAHARRRHVRELQRAKGVHPRGVADAHEAGRIIRDLGGHGLSLRAIAKLSGVGRTTVSAIAAAGAGRSIAVETLVRLRSAARAAAARQAGREDPSPRP